MKKHIVLISVGVLNVLHGSFHIIQFIQSMFFVAYATHEHTHDEGFIEQVMHHPIFALLMGIIGILTLVIGIKDYRHHKKCQTEPHEHHHTNDLPKLSEVLTANQICDIYKFYIANEDRINKKVSEVKLAYPPSEIEDKNNPMIWKDEYWKWFLIQS